MKGSTATIAIVRTRLLRETHVAAAAVCLSMLVAYVQRYDDAPAHTAAAIALCALYGIAAAWSARSSRFRELAVNEASAPLYAREIARARTLAPCALVLLAAVAYWAVSAVYGAFAPLGAAQSAAAGCAAAALSICGRRSFIAAAVALAFASFFLWQAAALLCCAAAFYAALRQYGEILARRAL